MIGVLREAMKQPIERRLTAILAADVAGYSRLIGADEAIARREGELRTLRVIRLRRRDQQGSTLLPTGVPPRQPMRFRAKLTGSLRASLFSALERQAWRALYGYTSNQDSEKDSTCST